MRGTAEIRSPHERHRPLRQPRDDRHVVAVADLRAAARAPRSRPQHALPAGTRDTTTVMKLPIARPNGSATRARIHIAHRWGRYRWVGGGVGPRARWSRWPQALFGLRMDLSCLDGRPVASFEDSCGTGGHRVALRGDRRRRRRRARRRRSRHPSTSGPGSERSSSEGLPPRSADPVVSKVTMLGFLLHAVIAVRVDGELRSIVGRGAARDVAVTPGEHRRPSGRTGASRTAGSRSSGPPDSAC